MERKEAEQRIEVLRREIHDHNYQYHVLDRPVISDEEYDRKTRSCSGWNRNTRSL